VRPRERAKHEEVADGPGAPGPHAPGHLPGWIAAQGDAPDLLREARRELVTRHLDSAASLLREVGRDKRAPAATRAEAFVLLGVTRYHEGKDSAAVEMFRSGLNLDPQTNPPAIIAQDSLLDELWLKQRVWAAGPVVPPDTLFSCVPRCVGLDAAPSALPRFDSYKILVEANGAMNQYGVVPDRANAILRLTVDTIGRVEEGSVEVVHSTLPREMLESIPSDIGEERYRPGQTHGRAVRVRIQFEVTMRGSPGP
jgi:hypothetical protein